MKGKYKGVQAIIKRLYGKAAYTHCTSHSLNLSLNDAAEVTEVQQAFGVVKEVCNFFRRSAPRSAALKRAFEASPDLGVIELVSVCETRWVERHRAVIIFVEALYVVVSALEGLEDGQDAETDIVEKEKSPSTLHRAICSFQFIVTVSILEKCMSVTYSLSKYLQSVNIDLFAAMERVEACTDLFRSMRVDDEHFQEIFQKAVGIADQLGVTPNKPRTVGTQRYRSNQPSASVEEFYKRSVFIPYLDYLITALQDRFIDHRRELEGLACVIPKEAAKRSFTDLQPALIFYSSDLPASNESILKAEWDMWSRKIVAAGSDAAPNAIEALNLCNRDLFPNMFVLLQILATLAVTTATPERTFSLLKRLKTWLRNAVSEDRLVGLALISVYRDMPIDKQKLIAHFFAKKNRRL